MKKTLLVLFCAFMVSACGPKRPELRIFNWIAYIPEDIYLDFEKETGIRIVEDAVGSNEELYAKVRSAANYDIVVPGLNYAPLMIAEGLVDPFDPELVPNFTNIDPSILQRLQAVDPEHKYLVPFAYGPTVIAYDTNIVSEDITGFDIFENPKYKGQMSMMNDMRELMIPALKLNGYPINSTNSNELKVAADQIRRWKANILRFDSDNYQKAYADREVVIVHGFSDALKSAMNDEKRQSTKMIVPKNGVAYLDSMVILNQSQNKEAAMQFMNFIHRPDIYARLNDYHGTPNINTAAQDLKTEESWISLQEIENSDIELLTDIGEEATRIQSRVWEEILAE
ncbi:MAG: ABC transporter substrate-binding protein [Brevinema sp.]